MHVSSSVHIRDALRKYRRLTVAVTVLLAVIALLATAHATSMTTSGPVGHAGGHGQSDGKVIVKLCVATGACMLLLAGAFLVFRRIVQRLPGASSAPRVTAPLLSFVPTPYLMRAGPSPPLLQVFRF